MKIWLQRLFKLVMLFGSSVWASELPSVAFFYGPRPPFNELRAFNVAVVEPDHVRQPRQHASQGRGQQHELFAYVSLGEVHPTRPYYPQLPKSCLAGHNEAWGSRVINQASPEWMDFFLDTIIAPLWQKGWRSFFLDTLDSYQLFAKTELARAQQAQAMVGILRELKARYPEAKLMLNRGFELLPDIGHLTYAVAAESLYQGYRADKNSYGPVVEADRNWLLGELKKAHDVYELPIIVIDYVDPKAPNRRTLARETADRIQQLGYIPWVADGGLMSVGTGLSRKQGE